MAYLIADNGGTKCDWCLVSSNKKTKITTVGISPYFLSKEQIIEVLQKSVATKIKVEVDHIFFYSTGMGNTDNIKIIKAAFQKVFASSKIEIETDLLGAARALLQQEKGIASILGTGTNCGFYNGKKIMNNRPGLGYILGDEGSGAYLGKKVIQYYLYNTFDEELMSAFNKRFAVDRTEILNNVYKQPNANKYIAAFTIFLQENRGHYMIENIIEDAFHDFIFLHLYKFKESWQYPVSFSGGVAFAFKDVIKDLCNSYELELGKIIETPMQGLIQYHSK